MSGFRLRPDFYGHMFNATVRHDLPSVVFADFHGFNLKDAASLGSACTSATKGEAESVAKVHRRRDARRSHSRPPPVGGKPTASH